MLLSCDKLLVPVLEIVLCMLTLEDELNLKRCCVKLRCVIKSWRHNLICNIPRISIYSYDPKDFIFRDDIIFPSCEVSVPIPRGVYTECCYLQNGCCCGWGLFSRRVIGKGSIIACYGGEYLSTIEIKRRQKIYDVQVTSLPLSYLLSH
jgi:hypothetical protein